MSAVGVGCCWMLGVVFGVSAVGKLRSAAALRAFVASVADMRVLPTAAVRPVGVAVPVIEAVAAVLALVPATAVVGCVIALLLLAAFTTGIAAVVRRGTVASCRCFGVRERPFGPRHLVRNGLLLLVALGGAVFSESAFSESAFSESAFSESAFSGPDLAMALLAGGVGVVGAVLVVMFDDLVDLFATPARS